MRHNKATNTTEKTCRGGKCAETCPVYNPGGKCPSVFEVLALFRARADALVD